MKAHWVGRVKKMGHEENGMMRLVEIDEIGEKQTDSQPAQHEAQRSGVENAID